MRVFVVALKGLASKISRVSYEKDEKDLRLYFALEQGELAPENLLVEPAALVAPSIVENGGAEHKLAKFIAKRWQYLSSSRLFAAFLKKDDLRECQANEKMIPAAIKKLRTPAASVLVVVEGNDQHSTAVLWSTRKELRQKMLWYGEGTERGDWVILRIQKQRLEAAKNKILSLL